MSTDPARLRIVNYPHPALREKTRDVEVTDEVRAVAGRMLALMAEAEGVGLAAPQVGLDWRMFVCRLPEAGAEPAVYVNPRLELHKGDVEVHEEGCLSLPGLTADIRRPVAATITALDLEGNEFRREASGFEARIWQHETDHLDGVLIIDRMNPMDRLRNRKLVKELEAAGTAV